MQMIIAENFHQSSSADDTKTENLLSQLSSERPKSSLSFYNLLSNSNNLNFYHSNFQINAL